MKLNIEIDTKHDSHEDIRKIVSLLSSLSKENASATSSKNIFESSSSELNLGNDMQSYDDNKEPENNGLMNMFNTNSSSGTNIAENEEDKEETNFDETQITTY